MLGRNYRFLDEGAHPALIGFADISLLENTASSGTHFQSAKSGTLGITTYRVLAPVVLSLTAGYAANFERITEGARIDPSDTLSLNPSIAFAVNNELTLTGGFGINFSGDDAISKVGTVQAISGELLRMQNLDRHEKYDAPMQLDIEEVPAVDIFFSQENRSLTLLSQ